MAYFLGGIGLVISSIVGINFSIPKVGDCQDYEYGFCVNYWDSGEVQRARITNVASFGVLGIVGCVMIIVAIVGYVLKPQYTE